MGRLLERKDVHESVGVAFVQARQTTHEITVHPRLFYIIKFCEATGFTISSLFNVFTKAVLRERRIPFTIFMPEQPNAETIAAMEEGERIAHDPTVKGYTDLKELWKDLEK